MYYTQYTSYQELERVKGLTAFNLPYKTRKYINQYKRMYTFSDGSILEIYPRKRSGFAMTPHGILISMEILKISK